jgi:A/G-specific adenine glycosylase
MRSGNRISFARSLRDATVVRQQLTGSPIISHQSSIIDPLTAWFDVHQRTMPWRSDPTPYRVWISEIMLQQTQVDTVIPYFDRFLERFPDINALATADQQDVLKGWEGLGYYSRARNLHKAAKIVADELNGEIPNNYDDLLKLPGLGPYTAAAVASIAFDEHVPVVDGNVLRVFARFRGVDDDIAQQRVRREFAEWLQPHVNDADPSTFNQAIMELGALVCRPRNPTCLTCPLRDDCTALTDGRVDELPVKTKKAKPPHHPMTALAVSDDGRFLIRRRPEDGFLGGLWEIPSIRLADSESAESANQRLANELGVEIYELRKFGEVKHAYSHFSITVAGHQACPSHPPDETESLKWVDFDEADTYPFDKASLKLIALLREA